MRTRALVRGSALGTAFCLLCVGQISFNPQAGTQQNQPNQVRTISGTVVNSITGEPIPRALVRVMTNQGSAAMTGSDGHFEIQNVPANWNVAVMAERPGYSQGRQSRMVTPLMISPGENNITIKLIPEGSIHGRILDEEGQPIEGIQVQAITEMIMNGRKREQPLSTTTTDDNGEYEMDGLTPGTCFLRTIMHPLYWASVPLPAAQQAYPSDYYPDAPDRSAAQALDVQPGQTAEADFALKPVRTFRITGVITRGSGPFAVITLKGPDGERTWTHGERFDRQTGHFTLSSVPAGSWTLEVRMSPGGNFNVNSDSLYGEQQVQVDSADIRNVQISLQQLAPIPVNVVHAPATQVPSNGSSPTSGPEPQIQLIPREGSGSDPFVNTYTAMRSKQQSPTPDTLEFRGVPTGSYRVAAHTFNSNECIDTVSSGSSDLMTQDLTVSAGAAPQPITVTLRSDCATLSGTVHAQGSTAPVSVLVIPDSGAVDPQVMSTAPESQFKIAGLTPGSYRVYAFSTLDGLEYTNPDALRDFEAKEVTLGANEKANIALNLIVRGEQ